MYFFATQITTWTKQEPNLALTSHMKTIWGTYFPWGLDDSFWYLFIWSGKHSSQTASGFREGSYVAPKFSLPVNAIQWLICKVRKLRCPAETEMQILWPVPVTTKPHNLLRGCGLGTCSEGFAKTTRGWEENPDLRAKRRHNTDLTRVRGYPGERLLELVYFI